MHDCSDSIVNPELLTQLSYFSLALNHRYEYLQTYLLGLWIRYAIPGHNELILYVGPAPLNACFVLDIQGVQTYSAICFHAGAWQACHIYWRGHVSSQSPRLSTPPLVCARVRSAAFIRVYHIRGGAASWKGHWSGNSRRFHAAIWSDFAYTKHENFQVLTWFQVFCQWQNLLNQPKTGS